jgi:hypothetical protein
MSPDTLRNQDPSLAPELDAGWVAGRAPDNAALERALQRAGEASGGCFSCVLVDAAYGLALIRGMRRGSELAVAYLGVLGPYSAALEAARSRRDGDRCLCCDAGAFFRRCKPTVIALLLPSDVADPGSAVVMGICERCARAAGWPRPGWRDALVAKMTPALQEVWPDCRFITPTAGAAGSA